MSDTKNPQIGLVDFHLKTVHLAPSTNARGTRNRESRKTAPPIAGTYSSCGISYWSFPIGTYIGGIRYARRFCVWNRELV